MKGEQYLLYGHTKLGENIDNCSEEAKFDRRSYLTTFEFDYFSMGYQNFQH